MLDEGSTVATAGVLADIFVRDDGSECLVLADLVGGITLKVYCSQGIREMPAQYASIGDEVRALGELAGTANARILFTTSDRVAVARDSESVLTVAALGQNWALFEGDELTVCGILISGPDPGFPRLSDPDLEHSISIQFKASGLETLIGKQVTVTGHLRLESETMSLVLVATSLTPGGGNAFLGDR